MATGSRSWARRISERVVAQCTNLSHMVKEGSHTGFALLFNNSVDVWREEDFVLIETVGKSRNLVPSRRIREHTNN